jgi:hypothetical protein
MSSADAMIASVSDFTSRTRLRGDVPLAVERR